MNYPEEKKQVAKFMRRLYKTGLTTTSGGNVSIRTINNIILITPSQTDKGKIKTGEIVEISPDGTNLTPEFTPSMETGMHLEIYKARPDVFAIVHAHPVYATAYAVSGKKLSCNLAGESRAVIGELKVAEYELMGSAGLAKKVAVSLEKGNVALMQNHGAIAVGKNLLQAFDRIEVLESSAKISFITSLLGGAKELSEDQLRSIDLLMNKNPQ